MKPTPSPRTDLQSREGSAPTGRTKDAQTAFQARSCPPSTPASHRGIEPGRPRRRHGGSRCLVGAPGARESAGDLAGRRGHWLCRLAEFERPPLTLVPQRPVSKVSERRAEGRPAHAVTGPSPRCPRRQRTCGSCALRHGSGVSSTEGSPSCRTRQIARSAQRGVGDGNSNDRLPRTLGPTRSPSLAVVRLQGLERSYDANPIWGHLGLAVRSVEAAAVRLPRVVVEPRLQTRDAERRFCLAR